MAIDFTKLMDPGPEGQAYRAQLQADEGRDGRDFRSMLRDGFTPPTTPLVQPTFSETPPTTPSPAPIELEGGQNRLTTNLSAFAPDPNWGTAPKPIFQLQTGDDSGAELVNGAPTVVNIGGREMARVGNWGGANMPDAIRNSKFAQQITWDPTYGWVMPKEAWEDASKIFQEGLFEGPSLLMAAALGLPALVHAGVLGSLGAATGAEAGASAGGAGAATGGAGSSLGSLADFSLAPPGAGIGGVGTAGLGLSGTPTALLTPEMIAAAGGEAALAALPVAGAGTGAGLGLALTPGNAILETAAKLAAQAGVTLPPASLPNFTPTPASAPGATPTAVPTTTQAPATPTSPLSKLLKEALGVDVDPSTLDLIGQGLATGLGYFGAKEQADLTKDLFNTYLSLGAPYRQSLEQLNANPESFYSSPMVQGALQQGSDALARSLSANVGNPILNPTALQEMQNFTTRGLLDAFNNRFGQLAAAGQLGVSQAAPLGLQSIQAKGDVQQTLGAGIGSLFGNQRDYAGELLDILRGRNTLGMHSLT